MDARGKKKRGDLFPGSFPKKGKRVQAGFSVFVNNQTAVNAFRGGGGTTGRNIGCEFRRGER